MEFAPTGPATDDSQETQESMFSQAAEFPGHDLTELPTEPEVSAPEERDDYAEPPLSQERDWEPSEVPGSDSLPTPASEADSEPQAASYQGAVPDPALTHAGPLTIGDFAALEERVLRAVGLVRREREARVAAERRAEVLEGRLLTLESQMPQLQADTAILEQLQQEVESLRAEREQVRHRVERLLGQLDALEL